MGFYKSNFLYDYSYIADDFVLLKIIKLGNSFL